ncbi:FAD-dependent oxidoreductase [Candidatus Micrarchaeota archaeon]|nr:FAD-dependent oxidoreductase [Candidatus Micrarchaeota archaeon]MBU1930580.1 FAD-dependent oxidoreductase [Candidatus Micrarchaeota archaeon]
MSEETVWDIVIVGRGVTGLAAAMYAGRLEMKTLLVGEIPGGLITWTDVVENYPGFKRLTGMELTQKLEAHAKEYPVTLELGKIESIKKEKDLFELKSTDKVYHAKSVLIATGTKVRELNVPGAQEFKNKGVQFCALCDASLFKGKDMAIVGGSDSAVKEAMVLARFAKTVYIIYRKNKLRAEPTNLKRLEQLKNVKVIFETNITEIKGDKTVSSVVLDKSFNGSKELKVGVVFIAIGHIPLSDIVKSLGVRLNEKNEIVINRNSETNVPGVFAAGDVVDTQFKQAIVGVGEAVSAVYSALQFISKKN